MDFETSHGRARARLEPASEPAGALVLGHGAGGGIDAADLRAATRAANLAGFTVVLVEQPYRVAGRRAPAPARQLDAVWLEVVGQLREDSLQSLPVVVGGRSAGARVACRTAAQADAAAVLCLAFPLHPPGRAGDPTKSRLAELDAVAVPVLVVQGQSDPFGMPPPGANRTVVPVLGNHSLRDTAAVEAAVTDWLRCISAGPPR